MPFWDRGQKDSNTSGSEEAPDTIDAGLSAYIAPGPSVAHAEVITAEESASLQQAPLPVPEPTDLAHIPMWLGPTRVLVPLPEIGRFQAIGFLLHEPADLPMIANEIAEFASLLGPAAQQFVAACISDHSIDTRAEHEYDALLRIRHEIEHRIQNLMNVTFQNFPVRTEET